MDREIVILDLFSGIGGFSKGLKEAGFKIKKHYFSEVNPHAIACYQYNFPDAVNLGDITKLDTSKLNGINIITFGSPCQNFSLAGNRKGLKGKESSLIKEAMRVVRELQPDIFIWENVKGAFSSNARRDFWAILQSFTNLGPYRLEWQLLNTKWFLPQNRERIYLIGHLAGSSLKDVFPISENDKLFGCKKYPKKRQPQAKYCTTINPKFGSRATDTFLKVGDFRYDEGLRLRKNNCCPTLNRKSGGGLSNQPILRIKNNTKMGYKIATVNDSINFAFHTSNSRRGRVGKGTAQTLDTSCNQAIINSKSILRRLTEVECERLQGFPDDWTAFGNYNGEVKAISKTQRYGLIGNAVTVAVVREIGKRLLAKD